MSDGSVVRLFTFRAARPAFDEILREDIVPDLRSRPGIVDCYSARQGPDELGPRVVVSIWASRTAMTAAVGQTIGAGPLALRHPEETTDGRLEVLPLEIAERYVTTEPARILRILRGTVRSGERSAYVDDVRAGARTDAQGSNGPVSLYLAAGPDDFITLSTWRSWTDIEAATGGDVHRPRATRHPERLIDWDVSHFEIVMDRG